MTSDPDDTAPLFPPGPPPPPPPPQQHPPPTTPYPTWQQPGPPVPWQPAAPPHPPVPYPPYPAYQPVVWPSPTAPYGVDPATGLPYSDKSRVVAGLLQLLLPFIGVCGVGRLYAGHLAIGLLQLLGFLMGVVLTVVFIGLLIFPAVWLWAVIDGIVILASAGRDGQGRPLRA